MEVGGVGKRGEVGCKGMWVVGGGGRGCWERGWDMV